MSDDTTDGHGVQHTVTADSANPPLAQYCSLCGDGYSPNLTIEISDEPIEPRNGGRPEYRWCHEQCKRDHERHFIQATPEDEWDIPD